MISILDIIYELMEKIKACIPMIKQYLGKLPENYTTPCFVYFLVHNNDTRSSYFVKDVTLNLQIIYFCKNNDCESENFEDKLNTMQKLKEFLSQFNLNVGDRNLKFDYSFGEADEQLTIDIQFKFKDGVINPKFEEEQAREMIENININDKEII